MRNIMLLSLLLLVTACVPSVTPEPALTELPPTVVIPPTVAFPTPTAEQLPAVRGESPANADVEFVRAAQSAGGAWTFSVTVRHPDTGWDDYADGWDVVLPDGSVIKPTADSPFTRLLTHPHENEQPFTRSQSGIIIPDGVTTVLVRAHDLVDGWGGREVQVDLMVSSGPGFEVTRQGAN